MYQEIYNLKNDAIQIRLIQEVSLSENNRIGLKMENGLLYGSNEWFHAVNNGTIPKCIVHGYISKIYMGGHNDFPEFEVTDLNGVKTVWEKKGNDAFYIEGRGIEIIYISQKFKTGNVTNCIIKISIDINS
jgi:hypothetical protein